MTFSSKLCFGFFLFLLLVALSNTARAQPGCEMEIFLRTQAEVDAFVIPGNGLPGVVPGGIIIGPEASNGTTDITNLDGLSSLVQVHGTLLIERNPLLTDISGLSNLTTIGGGTCAFQELIIRENPLIESLDGLQSLTGFVSRLMIQDAPLITDLDEITNVTGSDFLWLGGLTGITNVDPLSNFTTLRGFYLTDNENLLNLDGLSGVSGPFTGGQDFISHNPMLQNLNGLAGVTKTNILTVRNCDALVDLSGLGGITEVTDILSINNNPGLTSLNGLHPTLEINGQLTVVGNAQLSDCAVEAVCNHLNMNGNNFFTANPAGCANATDVLDNCYTECAENITETLTTQEEVDAFATTYGNCRNFLGEIIIDEPQSRSAVTAITNLDALSNLRQIGVLRILNAPSLDNLSGLAMLDSINGDLDIRNTAILNLSELSNLKKIGRRLDIAFNSVLESITSFSEVDLIPNFLVIRFNPMLNDLSGFSNLVTVSDVLQIIGNPSLPDLADFSSLRFAFDGLEVNNNDMLTSLAGLETLENINASLRILNNDLLSDISTLNNLDQSTIVATSNGAPGSAALIIRDNPLLSNCAIETVCTFLEGSGTAVDIQGNALNCESQLVVENNCDALPVSLHAFTALLIGKAARLYWQTASEENTQNYTLERSADGGRTFQPIGLVAARNNRTGANYQYIDDTAASLDVQRLYYRLYAQDFDGTSQRFGPVVVEMSAVAANLLKVFPNPTTSGQTINIKGAAAGAKLELRAVDGRLLSTLVPSAGGVYSLPDVQAGVYLLRSLGGQGERLMGRFVVR